MAIKEKQSGRGDWVSGCSVCVCVCVCVCVRARSVLHTLVCVCLTSMDCSPPGFSVCGIFQARMLQ